MTTNAPIITFCHPGYGTRAKFLHFQALDKNPANPARLGILHQVALDACRIVANNTDGFLSPVRDRAGRIPTTTVLLCEPLYWYFLADDTLPERYPIVDDFRAWTFPQQIPAHWSAARPGPGTMRTRPPLTPHQRPQGALPSSHFR